MAFALLCKPKQLLMWGCDFSYDRNTNSHDEQGRACCEYWIGRLVQSGTRVGTSTNTHLMDSLARAKGGIYGYHEGVVMEFPDGGGKGRLISPDYADQ